jgi:hypothetical protein
MKKRIVILLILLTGQLSYGQVPREQVVMEYGTGTWCTYCPGAQMGAADLLANGCSVAVIANHNGDPFANSYSNARNSYYGITGYPTAKFDGVLSVVGGNHSSSMYPSYLPKYNQRIAIPSCFTIDISGHNEGLTYYITLVLTKVATNSETNIKAHLVLTESNIVYAWQGQTEIDHTCRLMAPDQNGTVVDFSSLETITLNLEFTLDPAWVTGNLELVAFLQNNSTKECLQGAKVLLTDLDSDVVPAVRNIQNVTISSGQSICYDATNTINTAGDGTTFTVESGGESNLISGGTILMFPGTLAASGSHVVAGITTSNTYCSGESNPWPPAPGSTGMKQTINNKNNKN